MVLAGMTVGNYVGGRIADRFSGKRVIALLFAIASIASIGTIVLTNRIEYWSFLLRFSWPVQVVTYVTILFLLPSVFLGAICPVTAKAALDHRTGTGRTIGYIYAFGAAGSIVGTFLAGFWLTSAIGPIGVIWATSAALAAAGLICNPSQGLLRIWAIMLALLVVLGTAPIRWIEQAGALLTLRKRPDPSIIYEDDSQYSHIRIVQTSKKPDERSFYQDKLQHSILIMEDITNLQYEYERVYTEVTEQTMGGKNSIAVLAIGGGGFVFPRYLKQKWPASKVDVAEIDPAVPRAAMAAFGLAKDSGINIFIMDGRNFIDGVIAGKQSGQDIPRYDYVYGDAYDHFSVPYQLVTREFNEKVACILKEDGVYMLNLIDIYESGLILGSVLNTLEQTFPHVYVLSPRFEHYDRSTFVLIAARRTIDTDSLAAKLGRYYRDVWSISPSEADGFKEKCGRIVLTDDYSPTDNLTAPIARQYALTLASNRHIENANRLRNLGSGDRFISEYFEAIRVNPRIPISTYCEIAKDLMTAGEFEEATEVCKKALKCYDRPEIKNDISPIRLCMATALKNCGRDEEARKYFLKVIEEHTRRMGKGAVPVEIVAELGTAFVGVGNYAEAVRYFERAVKTEPANSTYRYMLSETLIKQKDYAGAQAAIEDAINAMKQAGDEEAVSDFNRLLGQIAYQKSIEQTKQP